MKDTQHTESLAVRLKAAKIASQELSQLTRQDKDRALDAVSKALRANAAEIFVANSADLANAADLAAPLRKRLGFQQEKLDLVLNGIEALRDLADPCGRIIAARSLEDGLELYQVTCPIGVVCMIFESRPDALVQIASLAIKSGNAVVCKGGSEAAQSNKALAGIIHDAAVSAGFPENWLVLAESRADVAEILTQDRYIDLIVPRGSKDFVKHIMRNSLIPVLGHSDGVCHVYVHAEADVDTAVRVAFDSKTQYVAVCNAAETLLVDQSIAASVLPHIASAMRAKHVRFVADDGARAILGASGFESEAAVANTWSSEYLDYALSVKIVEDMEEAILHINEWGSHHTDAIVTRNAAAAQRFMSAVDSGSVFWNASTRFADGYLYGLGAEVGIATGKIHARGPMGLEGLVTYKWKLFGSGNTVAGVYGPPGRPLVHRELEAREEPWHRWKI